MILFILYIYIDRLGQYKQLNFHKAAYSNSTDYRFDRVYKSEGKQKVL